MTNNNGEQINHSNDGELAAPAAQITDLRALQSAAFRQFNWRGDWLVNSADRWRNLKVIRNRHRVRESLIKPGKLTSHLVLVYMGAPSRQQTVFEGRNYNVLQTNGDVGLIPALSAMRSWYDEAEQDDVYLHLEPDFLKKVALECDADPDQVELITTFGARKPLIEQIAQLAFNELERGKATVGSNLYADSLANLLAVQLLREFSTRTKIFKNAAKVGGLAGKKLARVLELIHGDLAADHSLATLAQTVGLSEYYFLRAFKLTTGVTPHQYVLRQRIERGRQLLCSTALSITEIAYLIGFATPAHFAHHCRRRTGQTPSQIRSKA